MKIKNKILWIVFALSVLSTFALVIFGKNPFPAILIGIFSLLLVYALWDPLAKHKDFSYEDQQRAMRAFDRTDMIDLGIPPWAKKKKKRRRNRAK